MSLHGGTGCVALGRPSVAKTRVWEHVVHHLLTTLRNSPKLRQKEFAIHTLCQPERQIDIENLADDVLSSGADRQADEAR